MSSQGAWATHYEIMAVASLFALFVHFPHAFPRVFFVSFAAQARGGVEPRPRPKVLVLRRCGKALPVSHESQWQHTL